MSEMAKMTIELLNLKRVITDPPTNAGTQYSFNFLKFEVEQKTDSVVIMLTIT